MSEPVKCENCGTTATELWGETLVEVDRRQICYPCREDIQGENGAGPAEEIERPFALPLTDFIAAKGDAPEPLLGTEDDCILPALGMALLIAKGGKGKTTFTLDLVLHLAAGEDYLGLEVGRPLNVLLIENEGPQEPFRRKLERKFESWPHEIEGLVAVYAQNWGHARLDLPEFVERLNAYCEDHEIDLVIGDPLDSLGMDGEGSPSETRAMVDRFKSAGLFTERAWLLPHHSRKESVDDAVDEASGAWGGRPDAMLALEKRSDNQARLSFSKVRWEARERKPYLLELRPRDRVVLVRHGGGGRGARLRRRDRGVPRPAPEPDGAGDHGRDQRLEGEGAGGAGGSPGPFPEAHRG